MKYIYILSALSLTLFSFGCTGICSSDCARIEIKKESMNCKPTLFSSLNETITTPDGLALAPDQKSVWLSVPNYSSFATNGAKLVQLDKDGNIISEFKDLTLSPATNEVHPMGLEFAEDGNLYIADNQLFSGKPTESRLLRVIFKDGKPEKSEVIVEGLGLANAIRVRDGKIYVTDTVMPSENENLSGIYVFDISEFNGTPIKITKNDSHLLTTFTCTSETGVDGMCFDKDGNLYTGTFGDGKFFKVSFNKDGSFKSQEVIIDSPAFECCDGICYDEKTNSIYITNSQMNSVWVLDLTNNTFQRLWQNPDDKGETGLLDQPCEPLIWGNDLLVVNFDFTFPAMLNKENDSVHTVSKFKIRDCDKSCK